MTSFLSHPYFAGAALSGSLIVAIGAQNAHVLRQGLLREHIALVVLTCAVIDASLMAAGVFGVAGLARAQPGVLEWVGWLGAAFLVCYGLSAARRALRPTALQVEGSRAAPRRAGLVWAQTLAVSLLNPHVYLDTVFLVGLVGSQYPLQGRALFWGGAASMSALWFAAVGYGARWLTPVFARPSSWRLLDGVLALTLFYLAWGLLQPLRA